MQFGKLSRIRKIFFFSISPEEQRAWAKSLSHEIPNLLDRMIYTLPTVLPGARFKCREFASSIAFAFTRNRCHANRCFSAVLILDLSLLMIRKITERDILTFSRLRRLRSSASQKRAIGTITHVYRFFSFICDFVLMILLMILINVITFAVKRMAKVSFEYEI